MSHADGLAASDVNKSVAVMKQGTGGDLPTAPAKAFSKSHWEAIDSFYSSIVTPGDGITISVAGHTRGISRANHATAGGSPWTSRTFFGCTRLA